MSSKRFGALSVVGGAALGGWFGMGCSSEPEVLTVAALISQDGNQKEPSSRLKRGIEAATQWLNETHGGIDIDGKKYTLEYVFHDDSSSLPKVQQIAAELCDNAGIQHIWGPYSSGLVLGSSEVVSGCGKLLVNAGGASDSIYNKGYANNIQIFSPGSGYHRGTLDMWRASLSATNPRIALLYEDEPFAQSSAVGARKYAQELGFDIVLDEKYPKDATIDTPDEQFRDHVGALAGLNPVPDAVLGGGHTADGRALAQFLGYEGLKLPAVSILVAPAAGDFYEKVGCDTAPCEGASAAEQRAEGISTPSQWEPDAKYSAATSAEAGKTWFGPEISEFDALYAAISAGVDEEPTYHAAAGAASVLVFALAAERAKSLEPAQIFAAARALEVTTLFGGFDIDDTGLQVGHTMVEVQWQDRQKVVVWPEDARAAPLKMPVR